MSIKVLSYNIQSWDMNDRRQKCVVELIKNHNPDIVCLQEVTVKWYSLLKKMFGNSYTFCGRDRFYGDKEVIEWKKERNSILFKKSKFERLYSHTYWYGDDIKVPSITLEAEYKRIFTVVGLKEKATGKVFEQICTHLEYTTPHCRELQAKVLVKYIKKQQKTLLICGDFNSPPEENAYKLIANVLTDVGKLYHKESETYHAYGKEKKERIDFIFQNDGITAVSFKIIEDKYEGLPPSDHYPLECEFEIK